MTDTNRDRSYILANLFPDNVTGQISPQDLRDGVVSWMPEENTYAGDWFNEAMGRHLSAEHTTRGWVVYSQFMASAHSMGDVVVMNNSGEWTAADHTNGDAGLIIGLAVTSEAAATSLGQVLRRGLLYVSGGYSGGGFDSGIGQPFWMNSGTSGGVQASLPSTYSNYILGYIEPATHLENGDGTSCYSTDGGRCVRFDPDWAIV